MNLIQIQDEIIARANSGKQRARHWAAVWGDKQLKAAGFSGVECSRHIRDAFDMARLIEAADPDDNYLEQSPETGYFPHDA